MTIFRDIDALNPGRKKSAVAIGNFDGLHLGHAKILRVLCRISRGGCLRPVVLTFDPHPERALGRSRTLMIQTLEQRLALMKRRGLSTVLVTAFDERLSRLTPQEFVKKILKDRLNAAAVVVGRDFRFGRNRTGTIKTLAAEGRALGLRVLSVPQVRRNGRVVSSSLIRALLSQGRVEEARQLLGRPYQVAGRVVSGRSVGRTIGFPTANLRSANEILPRGVFITLARVGTRLYPSVTNIGFRPTFGPGRLSLESLLLDFSGGLYGRPMDVHFLKKIRQERKFSSPAALAGRIALDVQSARDYFKSHKLEKFILQV